MRPPLELLSITANLVDYHCGVALRSGGVGGRGLFCEEPVAAGQELFSIDSIICERQAEAALAQAGCLATATDGLEPPTWPSTLTGAALLLSEPGERWSPWLASWGEDAKPSPEFRWADWADDDVAPRCRALAARFPLCSATLLEDRARARRERFDRRVERWSRGGGRDAADFGALLPVVLSRAVRVSLGGESVMALVPGFDMLNHAPGDRRNVELAAAAGGRGLVVRATRPLRPGAELLTCYADVEDYDDDAAAHLMLTWGIPP